MIATTARHHAWSALAVLALAAGILAFCGGRLVYSLDDAYIHLSVAEQIAAGGYGINPGEFSAPSSSILWDFLSAPFSSTGVHHLIPLLINIASLFWSVSLIHKIILMILPAAAGLKACAIAFWFAVGVNLFGLVFTGMEHSLQVAVTLAVMHGVIGSASGRKVGRSMILAMIVGPAIRYELLAVTLGAAVILFFQGRRKTAIVALAGSLIPLLAFSLFLVSRGFPPLPSSVLAKLAEGGLSGGLGGMPANRLRLYTTDSDAFRFLFLLSLLPVALHWRRDRPSRLVAAFGVIVGLSHLLVGRYGWFGRYHIYSTVVLLLSLAWSFRNDLNALLPRGKGFGRLGILMIPLTVFLLPELSVTVKTPLASRVVFLQHGVMRRIALAYGDRVAVNDIGWVSYGNPNHVLDLWGLANEESRRHHLERGTGWVGRLVEADGAGLVMLYGSVFGVEVPENWTRVAVLGMTGPVVLGYPEVDIYLTPTGDSLRVITALLRVAETLPPGAILDFTGETLRQ